MAGSVERAARSGVQLVQVTQSNICCAMEVVFPLSCGDGEFCSKPHGRGPSR